MKFKDLLITKVCLGALIATAPLSQAFGLPYTWDGNDGGNSFLTDGDNWFGGTAPSVAADIGIFDNSVLGSTNPQVNANQTIGTLNFLQSTPYTFTWNNTSTLVLATNGVVNSSSALQTFTIGNGGTLSFTGGSANSVLIGQTVYNLDNGHISFVNSTASNAPINAINGTGSILTPSVSFGSGALGGTSVIIADATSPVLLGLNAQSQEAKITSNGNLANGIVFEGISLAGGGTNPTELTLNGSGLFFNANSDANTAVIIANALSNVVFNTTLPNTFTGTGPKVTLNNSTLTVTQANIAGQLIGDSTSVVALAATEDLTVTTPAATANVYAGNITGVSPSRLILNANATGSLELTGPIATVGNDWELDVIGGTLIGNTSNINRDILVNTPGTVQFKQAADGTFTELISGTGTLVKEGAARLIIDATSNNSLSFTGNTQINAGTFQLDGQIGGAIDVNSGGTLSGTGVAYVGLGQVVEINAGGTIAPGDGTIGTITLGDYIHNPNGNYQVQLNGSSITAVDLIHVAGGPTTAGNGTAQLNGGLVNVSSTDGTFLIDLPYTIVTADGGVDGEYDSAQQSPSTFNQYLVPNLDYDSNNVYLTLNTDFSSFAETRNELAVAEQLDSIFDPSEDLQLVLQNLVTLDPSDLNEALDQLSGAQYASLFQVSQLATRRFLRDLQVPFRLKNARNCDCECPTSCCQIEIWEDVQYGRSYLKGDSNAKGYRLRNIDATIGAQIVLDQCWTAGIAAYYENDHIDYHLGGKARVNTIIGALYGVYQNECYYLSSDLLLGYSHFNVRRSIEFADIDRTAHAHPKIWDVTSYTEAGLNAYETSCISLQPFLGLEFGWYKRNSFSESGADSIDLHAKSKNHWNFDSRLGLRATSTLPWDIVVSADVAWQHRYTSNDNTITLRFQEFGDDFSIRGPQQRRNGIDGTLFISKNICGDLNVYAQAIGERWKHFSNYTFAVGIDFKL